VRDEIFVKKTIWIFWREVITWEADTSRGQYWVLVRVKHTLRKVMWLWGNGLIWLKTGFSAGFN
jgi:hypothetical protein